MESFYRLTARTEELFSLLQDEKSRRLFWDRLKCDVHPTVENVADLYADGFDLDDEQRREQKQLSEIVRKLHQEGKRLLLYGAGGCGNAIAEILLVSGIPFDGFCDKKAATLKEVKGKPVYSPEHLFFHKEEFCVIVAVEAHYDQIMDLLRRNAFPENQILPYFVSRPANEVYFEFPQFYRPGTAFVDGGCFDGETSRSFAKWCGGQYSKIFALEPDEENAKLIRDKLASNPIERFQLYQAGLSCRDGEATFMSMSGASSYISDGEADGRFSYDHKEITGHCVSIPLISLDSMVGDDEVGFIKLDIEGAELDALMGSEKTLQRDKPFLAICIYHRQGDMLSIMDYLNKVVPEYRFWIRHYAALQVDTVLYAAVP